MIKISNQSMVKSAASFTSYEDHFPYSMNDQEEAYARELLKKEHEKRFAMRHPYLTGIPTLGIAPTVSKNRAYTNMDAKMLRTFPELYKAREDELRRQAELYQLETERLRATQPERAVASLLGYAALRNEQ